MMSNQGRLFLQAKKRLPTVFAGRIVSYSNGILPSSKAAVRVHHVPTSVAVWTVPSRHFAFTRHSGGGGKGGGGGGEFSLNFVYSPYEMNQEPDEEELMKFKPQKGKIITINQVKKAIAEDYGMETEDMKNLEYDDKGTWKKLTDVSQVMGKRAVPVRVPDMFSNDDDSAFNQDFDGDGDEGDYNEEDYMRDPDEEPHPGMMDDDDDYLGIDVQDTVHRLVATMKKGKYIVSPKSFQLKSPSGEVLSTRDYLLKVADTDEELRNVLVGKIGAMDHIINCIHYPFLWKDEPKSNPQLAEG